VDGGSCDATRQVAACFPHVRVLTAPRGRGAQMNAGARIARGDLLVFLHADTTLSRNIVVRMAPESGCAGALSCVVAKPRFLHPSPGGRLAVPPFRRLW
jgi:glycosyltransferase involved in cell wall biosynthesis